ncbi:MAG: acylphosphatase [Bacteroidales bacterium]|nr:acylphosphatase [Bacteroidales bacterium]
MQNLQINISGKVQNTGFPFYVKQFAQLYNIKGFVKFSNESLITIEVQGNETDLNKFIEYCRIGPEGSLITSVKISQGELLNHDSFRIIETKNEIDYYKLTDKIN